MEGEREGGKGWTLGKCERQGEGHGYFRGRGGMTASILPEWAL